MPFEEPWYAKLANPIVSALNLFLTAWLYPIWRTSRVRWSAPLADLADRARGERRPVIFYSWHQYEVVMLLAFRDVPDPLRVTGIGHDGLLSRLLHQTAVGLGYDVWIYRRRSPIRPKDQIIDHIRATRCNIGLIPDAGGPYRELKPGIAEIAQATHALVVPVVPLGRPTLTVPWPKRFVLPLPFCSVRVSAGAPIDGSTATAAECQRALEELEERATRGWSDGGA